MKGLIALTIMFFLFNCFIAYSQPFGPPIYIADPVKRECRYYFAGNQLHFNPRPEEYTIDIGYTTDFKSEGQACDFWRCASTNGTVKVDENKRPIEKDLCICDAGHYWDDAYGCVKLKQQEGQKTFLRLILGWIAGIFGK